ncbi:membrane protein [Lysinibacillus contaminans]|uniref:Membrane protein n=1 Tax=Lysinibacillus contaminans TaxID=1293441 RepID=A0ABR5K2F5_9BACI|nr:DUF3147 family protein [Lysinibacillus contaminans]KOS68865.1 membrane protein [Lysinibacillus contaminans]
MYTIIKIFSSAAIIGLVTELARRLPTYGGIIAALPLISLLSIIWLTVQGQTHEQIQQFTWGVILGLPATIVMLIGVYIALKNNLHIGLAIPIGVVCWGIFLGAQKWLTLIVKS